MRIAVLVSGRGSNLQAIIDSVESGKLDAQIKCVISDVAEAQALQRASNHGIEAILIDASGKSKEEYFAEVSKKLKDRMVELVVLAGFKRIIPQSFLQEWDWKVINVHPSLLPQFPGLHAQKQALQAGVKETGCTIHFVVPEVDAGPVILQTKVPVYKDDDERSLSDRILEEEHKILPKAIQLIAEKRVKIAGNKISIDFNGFKDERK